MCYYDSKKPILNASNNLSLNSLIKVRVVQLANKNQFAIYYNDGKRHLVAFQSYDSLIAIVEGENLYINWSYWDYSKTTLKHLKLFINTYTRFEYENKQQFLHFITSSDKVILFSE